MIETAGAIVLKQAATYLGKSFGKNVIERWSRYRANNFIDAFVSSVADGKDEKEVGVLLEDILSSDKKSELLFESYRSVSLSKSKELGPRAIGLLTAKIVAENRRSTVLEDSWFQVYESLTDDELIQTGHFYAQTYAEMRDETSTHAKLNVLDVEVYWNFGNELIDGTVDMSPLDLHYWFGSWAGKLGNLGKMRTTFVQRLGEIPVGGHRTTSTVVLKVYDEEFAELILKARRMVPEMKFGYNEEHSFYHTNPDVPIFVEPI